MVAELGYHYWFCLTFFQQHWQCLSALLPPLTTDLMFLFFLSFHCGAYWKDSLPPFTLFLSFLSAIYLFIYFFTQCVGSLICTKVLTECISCVFS